MLFIAAMLLAAAFAWFCAKPLKQHPIPFYIAGTVITVVVGCIGILNPQFLRELAQTNLAEYQILNNQIIGIFRKGVLAAALWCVVAWIGAVPQGSPVIKRLMPVRGELSIFSAAVSLSHMVIYAVQYIKNLLNPAFREAGRADAEFILTCIVCLLLTGIMIPLTVLSFKFVRRKIKGKTWKAIQRTAYGFYALIYIHIIVIYAAKPSTAETLVNLIAYSIVFVGYFVFRVRKAMVKKNKEGSKTLLNAVCITSFALVAGGMTVCGQALPYTPERTVPTAEASAPDAEETAPSDAPAQTETTTAAAPALTEQTSADATGETTVQETTLSAALTETETTVSGSETDAPAAASSEPAQSQTAPAQTDAPQTQPAQTSAAASTAKTTTTVTTTTAAPVPKLYNDGTYSASAYGYDGNVTVNVTIQNDVITSITASTDEADPWYFEQARDRVISQILSSQSTGVDAVSGATFSSQAIMAAVKKALSDAKA